VRALESLPEERSSSIDNFWDAKSRRRPRDNLVSVTFAMAATEFAQASQVRNRK
jgi:hypothetical protein